MSSKPKSVLHVLSSLNVGGAERFVIDLAVEQRQSLTLNTAILSFGNQEEPLVSECARHDISIHFINGSRAKKISDFKAVVNAYDVIHFHSPFTLLFACYVPFLMKRKQIIYTRHGAEHFNQLKWRIIHKIASLFVDHVTFVSSEAKSVFSNVHGWKDKSKTVIDNGILVPKLDTNISRNSESDLIKLGSVARMVPLKNQVCLLKALSIMPKELSNRFSVNFYGDGPSESMLRSETENLGLSNQVTFHGMQIDRNRIYDDMDVMIVTSEMEGLSIAILEAMARNIPVLATNVGGNPKLVKDGITGRLFEYNDHKSLSKYLVELEKSPELINSWGLQAHSMVKNDYSLKIPSNKYWKLYEHQKFLIKIQ